MDKPRFPRISRAAWAWIARGLLLSALGSALPAAAAPAERWYVVSIAGQPVGSVHQVEEETNGGRSARSDMELVLNRMGNKVEMRLAAESRESTDGALRAVDFDLRLSDQPTSQHAVIDGGVVRIENRAGGQSFARQLPFTGELLGPEGIRRRSAERLRKAGDRIHYQTYTGETGRVAAATRTVLAAESLEVLGERRSVLKIEEAIDGLPAPRLLWLDARGDLVAAEDAGPFGVMRTALADAATARRAPLGGELPAEMFAGSLVRTQVRLPHARETERLVIELTHRNPVLGWPDLASSDQRVLAKSDKALTLEITRRPPAAAATRPVAVTAANREYLEPNALLQANDPALAREAAAIVGDERDVLKAGLALERWVAEHMKFDLGVALAPAHEAFANRRGTCASYAALLTAMARAAGIPARYVMGYVYLDGIFGGHAWTEIQVGDDWVPLDAAVPADGIADAARFAFVRTSLAEGMGTLAMGPATQLFGQIDARVLEYQPRGEAPRKVAADARPYEVAGDRYGNAGLGVSWVKPAGWRFAQLDNVWPEDVLVAQAGPAGETVTLERFERRAWEDGAAAVAKRLAERVPDGQPSRLPAPIPDRKSAAGRASDGHAALAWVDGLDLWLLDARGPQAAALLERAAAGLSFETEASAHLARR